MGLYWLSGELLIEDFFKTKTQVYFSRYRWVRARDAKEEEVFRVGGYSPVVCVWDNGKEMLGKGYIFLKNLWVDLEYFELKVFTL